MSCAQVCSSNCDDQKTTSYFAENQCLDLEHLLLVLTKKDNQEPIQQRAPEISKNEADFVIKLSKNILRLSSVEAKKGHKIYTSLNRHAC